MIQPWVEKKHVGKELFQGGNRLLYHRLSRLVKLLVDKLSVEVVLFPPPFGLGLAPHEVSHQNVLSHHQFPDQLSVPLLVLPVQKYLKALVFVFLHRPGFFLRLVLFVNHAHGVLTILHLDDSFNPDLSAQDVGRNKPGPVLPGGLDVVGVFLSFGGVLVDQALKVVHLEGISIVAEDQPVAEDLNLDSAPPELVRDVFGILDQLPHPPHSRVLVLGQLVEVLRQLLGEGDVPRLVL